MNIIFSRWADDQDVRAVLLSLSDAARHSTELPQNKAQTEHIHKKLPFSRLPSPAEPEDDSKASHNESMRALAGQALQSADKAVVLRQNKNLHRFTFGSDLGNFLVLESDPGSDDDVRYINLSHCHLYPNPDSSGIWLENVSTSKHSAQDWSLQSEFHEISPGHSVPLHLGTWILNLGEGLRFILHATSLEEVRSPSMTIASKTSEINQKKSKTGSRTAIPKSRGKATIMVDNQKPAKQSVLLRSPDKTLWSQAGEIIGHTDHSRVERGKWAGKSAAIKVCRTAPRDWDDFCFSGSAHPEFRPF